MSLQRLKLLTLIPIITIVSCSGGDNGGNSTGEPNNTIMKANIPAWEKPINMKIDSVGDVDWYGMPVKGQGYVAVKSRKVPENINLQIRFAERQQWEATKHKWLSDWRSLPTAIPVPAEDTLFFVIQDDWNDQASDSAMEIRAEFITEFDDKEPNNEPAEATEISTGKKITTFIYPKGDPEYYKVSVDTQGYLFAKSSRVPEDLNLQVKYLAFDEWDDQTKELRDFNELPYGAFIADSGDYYIQMIDDWNDASSQEPIHWKVDFISEMDRHEPNNSREQATSFSIGDTLHPAIFPVNDQDYFKITPESKVTLQLLAKGVEDIEPTIRVHEKQETGYKEIADWQALPTKFSLEAGKTYILQLQDQWNDARRPESFRILTKEAADS